MTSTDIQIGQLLSDAFFFIMVGTLTVFVLLAVYANRARQADQEKTKAMPLSPTRMIARSLEWIVLGVLMLTLIAMMGLEIFFTLLLGVLMLVIGIYVIRATRRDRL